MTAYRKAKHVQLKCKYKYLDTHPEAGTFAVA